MSNDTDEKCTLCHEAAEHDKPWETTSNWGLQCAESLHKLLEVELFTVSFFEQAKYCQQCKELVRDVDFMTRSVAALSNRLQQSRRRIAKLLLDHFDSWTQASSPAVEFVPWTSIAEKREPTAEVYTNHQPVGANSPNNPKLNACDYANEPSECRQVKISSPYLPEGNNETDAMRVNGSTQMADADKEFLTQSNGGKDGEVENPAEPFRCEFPGCTLAFSNKTRLLVHQRTHLGWRPYVCSQENCQRGFTRLEHLNRHRKSVHRAPRERTSNSKQRTETEITTEITKVLQLQQRPNLLSCRASRFRCGFKGCQMRFSSVELLRSHITKHEAWKPFLCRLLPNCNAVISFKPHYHFNLVQRTTARADIETDTEQINIESPKLGNTLEPITDECQSFICDFPECGKTFRTLYLLDCHKPKHKGWRAYKCPVESCSASYTRRQHLRRHTQIVHEQPQSSSFTTDNTPPSSTITLVSSNQTSIPNEPSRTDNEVFSVDMEVDSVLDLEHILPAGGRRSARLRDKPATQKLTYNDEVSEAEEENSSSDFNASELSSDSDNSDNEGEVPVSIPNLVEPEVQRNEECTLGMPNETVRTHVANDQMTRLMTTFRLVANLTKSPTVQSEGVKASNLALEGSFCPTWEVLLGSAIQPNFPEESFARTYCFLFKLDKADKEKTYTYACSVTDCHKKFRNRTKWESHLNQVHGQFVDQFQCPICEKLTGPSGSRLDSHIDRIHMGVTYPFRCSFPLCDNRYRFENKLAEHMFQKHPTVPYNDYEISTVCPKRLLCNMTSKGKVSKVSFCKEPGCSYRTSFPTHMIVHRMKKHNKELDSKPFKCEVCGRGFPTVYSCRNHVKNGHKSENEKVKCTYCTSTPACFSTNTGLYKHIRTRHMDVATKFVCKICSRVSFTEAALKLHEELHEKAKGWKCVLGCGFDQAIFETQEALVDHVRKMHEELEKVLICHICGIKKTGETCKSKMKIHMLSHSKEKTFKCRYCDKMVQNVSERLFHEQSKHGNELGIRMKKYKCAECGEEFGVYLYYYRHCRNKHGSNPMPKFKRKKIQSSEAE